MEATANEIRVTKRMIMDGNSHDKIAKYLNTTINRVSGIMQHLTNENVEISFYVTLERVKQIEKDVFEAIDKYHLNPTLCNSNKVNNLNKIYSRCCAI